MRWSRALEGPLAKALTRDTEAFRPTTPAQSGFLHELGSALRRDTPAFTGRLDRENH